LLERRPQSTAGAGVRRYRLSAIPSATARQATRNWGAEGVAGHERGEEDTEDRRGEERGRPHRRLGQQQRYRVQLLYSPGEVDLPLGEEQGEDEDEHVSRQRSACAGPVAREQHHDAAVGDERTWTTVGA
jgi:hypothetical protein